MSASLIGRWGQALSGYSRQRRRCGLVLLYGFGTPALPSWDPKTRRNNLLGRPYRRHSGATAIEYGLIAAGITVAIIAVVQATGANFNTTFTNVSNAIK